MPLTKRKLRPRLVRFLHRKLEAPDTPENEKTVIGKILENDAMIGNLNSQVHGMVAKANLGEPTAEFGTPGDGSFLQQLFAFLSAHWAEILAAILKLLGI